MKRKYEIPIVLGLILFAYIINLMVYFATRLEEPVFLSHYYSQPMEENPRMKFYYIANRDEEKGIKSLSFLENNAQLGEIQCLEWEKTDIGVYSVYTADVEFCFPEDVQHSEIIVTRLDVKWEDNLETVADIGEIHLYPIEEKSDVMKMTGTGSDNGGNAYTKWQVMQDVEILGVGYYGENRFSDLLAVKGEGGVSLSFPILLSAGEFFRMDTSFVIPVGEYRRQEVVHVVPLLQVRCEDGSVAEIPVYNSMDYEPNLGFRQIYRILMMKGAI